MDTLALLCNLHADGPETLQILRRAGWDTLAELESIDAPALASALAISAERARRLQREARHLRERLEDGDAAPLPPDERIPSAAGAEAPAPPPPAPRSPLPRRGPRAESRTAAQRAEALPAEPSPSAPALDRELEEPARDFLIPRAIARPVPPEPRPPETPKRPAPGRAPQLSAAPALVAHRIDGLDPDTCERLSAAGIASLDELARALPLELAAATGLDYTRLLRLQFLARRRAPPAARSEPPAPPPSAPEAGADVAGPFA